MTKIMYIMTAPSGYSKTTTANRIKRESELQGFSAEIFSTDSQFMVNGEYKFNPAKLGEYHQKNKDLVYEACKNSINIVIVDNTNLTLKEIKPYVLIATMFEYDIYFIRPEKVHGTTNVHGVPEETILKMEQRMVDLRVMERYFNNILMASNHLNETGE